MHHQQCIVHKERKKIYIYTTLAPSHFDIWMAISRIVPFVEPQLQTAHKTPLEINLIKKPRLLTRRSEHFLTVLSKKVERVKRTFSSFALVLQRLAI